MTELTNNSVSSGGVHIGSFVNEEIFESSSRARYYKTYFDVTAFLKPQDGQTAPWCPGIFRTLEPLLIVVLSFKEMLVDFFSLLCDLLCWA